MGGGVGRSEGPRLRKREFEDLSGRRRPLVDIQLRPAAFIGHRLGQSLQSDQPGVSLASRRDGRSGGHKLHQPNMRAVRRIDDVGACFSGTDIAVGITLQTGGGLERG